MITVTATRYSDVEPGEGTCEVHFSSPLVFFLPGFYFWGEHQNPCWSCSHRPSSRGSWMAPGTYIISVTNAQLTQRTAAPPPDEPTWGIGIGNLNCLLYYILTLRTTACNAQGLICQVDMLVQVVVHGNKAYRPTPTLKELGR